MRELTPPLAPGRLRSRLGGRVPKAAAVLLVALAALAALVVPSAAPAAAAGKPVMLVYGDSVLEDARSQVSYIGSAGFDVRINTYGGTSLCDWLPQILKDAVPGTRLVALGFTGNTFTPCMRPGGAIPDDAGIAALYRQSLDQLIPTLRARGVALMLIGSPPLLGLDGSTVWPVPNAVYQQAAIDWRAAGADVVYSDAGRLALASPDGGWTGTLPCLPFETAAMGCIDGRIQVRAYDRVHFCPTGDLPCSVWSSGAWRYGSAIYDAAAFRIRPTTGNLDSAVGGVNQVDVSGWAIDPDNGTAPTTVHVYIDGIGYVLTANATRPDLVGPFPLAGAAHGFQATLPSPGGTHNVCAYAINVGAGGVNPRLACKTVTVRDASPFGNLETAAGVPGGVSVAGWAIDPDTDQPIQVHVYVDGAAVALTAGDSRPDVGAAFPSAGPNHGFSSALIGADPGRHQVCAYAINVGPGYTNPLLGCRTVTVPNTSPVGNLEGVTGVKGGVSVAGWALDPDTTSPIQVHLYVDSAALALTADGSRPDVAAAFPGYGSPHGFTAMLGATPGSHRVCAYGINVGPGANSLLGCRTVVVPA